MEQWDVDPGKEYAGAAIRADLLQRCSREKTRSTTTSRERPCKWHPGTVRNPASNAPFRPDEAWAFVIKVLKAGIPIEIMELDLPPDKRGFVIKPIGCGREVLYIKFEFGATVVFGRSFHVSDYQPKS